MCNHMRQIIKLSQNEVSQAVAEYVVRKHPQIATRCTQTGIDNPTVTYNTKFSIGVDSNNELYMEATFEILEPREDAKL